MGFFDTLNKVMTGLDNAANKTVQNVKKRAQYYDSFSTSELKKKYASGRMSFDDMLAIKQVLEHRGEYDFK